MNGPRTGFLAPGEVSPQNSGVRRCLWLVPALLVLAGPADASPEARPVPLEAAGSAGLAAFRRSLGRVTERRAGALARIAVFGDSHVACDLFTGALRRRLQARFGDGGHGFVLLGTTWSLYRPMDVLRGASPAFATRRLRPRDRVPFRFGLGSAVSTSRGPGALTWVETTASGPVGHSADRLELLYERAPGAGRMRVMLDGVQQAIVDTAAPQVAAGHHVIQASDAGHRMVVEALGPGPVTVYGAVLERGGPGVVVDALGVPALASTNLLSSDETLLREHLRERAPDLLVYAFGTNDVRWEGTDLSTYRRDVAKMLRRLRGGAPDASCLVLGPIDRVHNPGDGTWVASLEDIVARQRGAAADVGCAFWDQRAAMGGEGSMARWMRPRPRWTLRDGIHLSALGYDALAGALADVITR